MTSLPFRSVQSSNINEKTSNFFWGKSNEQAVKEVEEKFASFWPRNILILFGPPGVSDALFWSLFNVQLILSIGFLNPHSCRITI